MNLLYVVNFNAPMGGLHENVYSTALYMKKQNCNVYVVLKPGPLAERFEAKGIHTVTTEFSSSVPDVNKIISKIEDLNTKFDLIHFHPGLSKYAALHYGRKHNIPLVETYHGMWADDLGKHIGKLSALVTVSEGIKKYLQSRVKKQYEKYYVMPNGYNAELFNVARFYESNSNELNIGFITRLDQDKQFILDILILIVNHIKKVTNYKINIHLIGDGTLKDDFLNACQSLLENTKHEIVFKGWLVDEALKEAYLDCDIIVAPGRSAIEAMACGKPVIAVGSKNYIGLIKGDNWQYGVYNNFGGTGQKILDYKIGNVESDLDYLLYNKELINSVGEFSYKIARQFFHSDSINQKLLDLYEIIVLSKP